MKRGKCKDCKHCHIMEGFPYGVCEALPVEADRSISSYLYETDGACGDFEERDNASIND